MNTFKSRLQQRSGALGRRNCEADHSLRTRLGRMGVSTSTMHAWVWSHAGGITITASKVATRRIEPKWRFAKPPCRCSACLTLNVGDKCLTFVAGDTPPAQARRAFDARISRPHGRTCRPSGRLGPEGWSGRVRAAGLSPIVGRSDLTLFVTIRQICVTYACRLSYTPLRLYTRDTAHAARRARARTPPGVVATARLAACGPGVGRIQGLRATAPAT